MEGIDYLGPIGGALALAFGAGVTFAGSVIWPFVVVPLKKERDASQAARDAATAEHARIQREDLTNILSTTNTVTQALNDMKNTLMMQGRNNV